MELGKVTIIKYDNKNDLDNFISKLNYVSLNEIGKDMTLLGFKRELLIDEVLNDEDIGKYFYVDVDNVKVDYNYNVATQRGTEKMIVINNLISNLNLEKKFKLIFAFREESFQYSLIHRCNLYIEMCNGEIQVKKSTYNVYNF